MAGGPPVVDASAEARLAAEIDPAVERKVDRLGAVEAGVEARMVAAREGKDKLVRMLDEHVWPAGVMAQALGRGRKALVPKELVALGDV